MFGGEGAVQLTESAEARLARVETALILLIGEVSKLRQSMDRRRWITRLEEATKDAVPQVWKLRERVAQLERETVEMRDQAGGAAAHWEERQKDHWHPLVGSGEDGIGALADCCGRWVAATFSERGLGVRY